MASHHLQISFISTIILLVVFSSCLAIRVRTSTGSFEQNTSTNISQVFEDWITRHNRVYPTLEEKARRFEIFKAKYLYIQATNSEAGEKKRLYTVGLNAFSDLTREEFHGYKCTRPPVSTVPSGFKVINSSTLLARSFNSSLIQTRSCGSVYLDWSKDTWSANGELILSPVSPVRSQEPPGKTCGSCWAVAAVEAVETAQRVRYGPEIPLPPLSVQQILDCAPGHGCQGGSELDALAYIMKKRGLASEQGYPYTAMNGTCDESRADNVVGGSIEGLMLLQPPTNWALRATVCGLGPVLAGMAANSSDFDDYAGGIYNGKCGEEMDHTVLVVGYGEDEGQPYWKIQNSYGESWGEKGYMKLPVDLDGTGIDCRITKSASYPLVDITE